MAMLHLVRASAFSGDVLQNCFNTYMPQDSILLMDDGCYNVNHPLLTDKTFNQHRIYVVQPHMQARAMKHEHYTELSMADVVALIFKHENSITWS